MLNEIKSKYIMNKIFNNMKKILKLKLLKLNKKLKKKLNINLKDYSQYKKLKELNKKLNINIEDINISILYLNRRNIYVMWNFQN